MTSSARAAVCVCACGRASNGAPRAAPSDALPAGRSRPHGSAAGPRADSPPPAAAAAAAAVASVAVGKARFARPHRSRGTRAGTQPRSLGPPRRRTGPGDRHRPSGTAEAGRGGEARAGHALSDVLRGKDSLRHRRDLHEALGLPCLLFHVRCMDLRLRRSRVVRGTPSTEHRHRRLSASCRLRPAPCCPVSRLGASPARLP